MVKREIFYKYFTNPAVALFETAGDFLQIKYTLVASHTACDAVNFYNFIWIYRHFKKLTCSPFGQVKQILTIPLHTHFVHREIFLKLKREAFISSLNKLFNYRLTCAYIRVIIYISVILSLLSFNDGYDTMTVTYFVIYIIDNARAWEYRSTKKNGWLLRSNFYCLTS